jgi:hypothetical protein
MDMRREYVIHMCFKGMQRESLGHRQVASTWKVMDGTKMRVGQGVTEAHFGVRSDYWRGASS